VPTLKRACIFVDGENFRYSLNDPFQNGRFTFGRNAECARTPGRGLGAAD
jgi:hypothetical protein